MLLQTLSQSFMANPAAVHGLSAALAPPASASNGAPASTRSVAGGAAAAGLGPARDNASQHTVAVSLGKAWLELLVKLLRRASEGGVAVAGSGVVSSGTGEPNLVAAALEDPATRDALLILFERTAAGVAAAAAAVAASASAALAVKAVGTSDASPAAATSFAGLGSASSAEGRKALAWADPALVLRSLVLLREVLVHVPDAYVVPLRRRGVLHRLVFCARPHKMRERSSFVFLFCWLFFFHERSGSLPLLTAHLDMQLTPTRTADGIRVCTPRSPLPSMPICLAQHPHRRRSLGSTLSPTRKLPAVVLVLECRDSRGHEGNCRALRYSPELEGVAKPGPCR